jgi:hypothetical protein
MCIVAVSVYTIRYGAPRIKQLNWENKKRNKTFSIKVRDILIRLMTIDA